MAPRAGVFNQKSRAPFCRPQGFMRALLAVIFSLARKAVRAVESCRCQQRAGVSAFITLPRTCALSVPAMASNVSRRANSLPAVFQAPAMSSSTNAEVPFRQRRRGRRYPPGSAAVTVSTRLLPSYIDLSCRTPRRQRHGRLPDAGVEHYIVSVQLVAGEAKRILRVSSQKREVIRSEKMPPCGGRVMPVLNQ